jgi:hypothetical protein
MVQRRYGKFEGSPGFTCKPLKISGSEIKTIVMSTDAMNAPREVFERTVHLYAIPIG